jgi:hypothetical protein
MTLPMEPPRPTQDVAVGYALPVRARAAAGGVVPADAPGAFEFPEVAPPAPAVDTSVAAPAVMDAAEAPVVAPAPRPAAPARRTLPTWLWGSVVAGVLLGCGVAWLALHARGASPASASGRSAMEDLLDVAPLIGGEGAAEADLLEDAPLVRPGRPVRRTPAGKSLSSAFRGERGGVVEAHLAASEAEAVGAVVSEPHAEQSPGEAQSASEPAPAAEQLRRPNF